MGQRAIEFIGDRGQAADDLVFTRVGELVAQEFETLNFAAAAAGHARAIFAGEQARGQRTPGGQAQAQIFIQTRIFLFDPAAVEQVVLGLFHHRFVQMMALGDLVGGADFVGAPFRGAPIQGFAARNHIAHGPYRFFNGRSRIGAMAEHQVDIIELQALERSIDGVMQVFAIQRVKLVRPAIDTPEKFGRDRIADARPSQLF